MSSPLPGGPEVARIGALTLVPLFAFLSVLDVATSHGPARWLLAAPALVTAMLAIGRVGRQGRRGAVSTSCMVWFICAAPIMGGLLHIALTGRLEHTTMLMMAIVGAGAMMTRVDHALALTAASVSAWAGIVAFTGPYPTVSTAHHAVELVLATALAGAVLSIRSIVGRRLAVTEAQLVRQLAELEDGRARLVDSLARFRGVFDDSPVGISLNDEHGRFVQVNEALCRLLGRPEEQLIGAGAQDSIHPDDGYVPGEASLSMSASADGVGRFERRYVRGGEVRWADMTVTHVDGPDGARWTLAHIQDVTERRRADEAVARGREALAAAAEISRVTQLGGDPRPVVVRQLLALAGASSVSLIEAQGTDLLAITAAAGKSDLVGIEIALDEASATTHVWHTGEPLFVSSAQTHPLVNRRAMEHHDARAAQWQPVGVEGKVSAVLAIVWDSSKAGVTEVDRSVVEVLAAETGAALAGERLRHDLERLSLRDPLTGLLNRRGWDRDVDALRAGVERHGRLVTLAVVDLDLFKRYNDTHGHAAGDDLLTEFAGAATRALRHTDLLARWGGEEFTVALADSDGVGAAEVVARLRAAVPGRETCSVGFAQLRRGETVADCLLRADEALYTAKMLGRDQAVDADRLVEPSSVDVGLVA